MNEQLTRTKNSIKLPPDKKQQKKALSNEKRNKKWHLDYKPQLKRSYSYLYKFSLENYITQIDMYSGIASFSINDQFNKKFVFNKV